MGDDGSILYDQLHINVRWISDVFTCPIAINLLMVWTVLRDFVQVVCAEMLPERHIKAPGSK